MVHSDSGCTRGVQVKLWDPSRTRAIPERLRGVFTTRHYTNPRLPYLTLPCSSAGWWRPNCFAEASGVYSSEWLLLYSWHLINMLLTYLLTYLLTCMTSLDFRFGLGLGRFSVSFVGQWNKYRSVWLSNTKWDGTLWCIGRLQPTGGLTTEVCWLGRHNRPLSSLRSWV